MEEAERVLYICWYQVKLNCVRTISMLSNSSWQTVVQQWTNAEGICWVSLWGRRNEVSMLPSHQQLLVTWGQTQNQCLWCNAATHSKRRSWGPQGKAFEIFEGWLRITRQKRVYQAEGTACVTIYTGGGWKEKTKGLEWLMCESRYQWTSREKAGGRWDCNGLLLWRLTDQEHCRDVFCNSLPPMWSLQVTRA